MSSVQRTMIANPTTGLMAFDSTINAFYYYTGNDWLELLAGRIDQIADADGDKDELTDVSDKKNRKDFERLQRIKIDKSVNKAIRIIFEINKATV